MTNVIVAFSKAEDAKNIKNILMKNGFTVSAVCTSGAQALNSADELGSGIVVCGGRFADMMYQEIYDCLPGGIRMLLVASPSQWSGRAPDDIVCLGLPLKVQDLLSTLEMMMESMAKRRKKLKSQPKERNSEELELIKQAKELLMERNHMTESEAHRYIQKCSMDSGTNMVETAQMIMSLINI
ncbi:ANTAR domain-containing protein [Clostridium boliviensis]|uniref:ANTAR domain-containing protein n=1 Tax=Clostridium boliviensis TaxID=318465 RepID=A0ABU4GF50_9CLOT|nr:ANTAR domain-containing protein [Clostridium boliviensis]MDW2796248.1 ANTAR domain-containing protein [Clostridium boliviensis]